VFLSEQDLDRLAKYLHIDPAEFIETYCRWVPAWNGPEDTERLSLKEKSNYDCIFWNQGCTQYEARPLQCRSFPFWPSILAAVDSWNATAAACPGMGQGALHSKEEILSYLKQTEPIITRKDRTWP
jgi:Fe-S-cluster containining protein